jgi:hypothetical protein
MLAAYYPTKKALKASIGMSLHYGETSMFGSEYRTDGTLTVVGPTEYKRKWFAQVTMVQGKIAKVN